MIGKNRQGMLVVNMVATVTEVQNNFEKYMAQVQAGKEIIITKNGKEIGRLVPSSEVKSFLTDSITGILQENYNMDQVRDERLKEKYATDCC